MTNKDKEELSKLLNSLKERRNINDSKTLNRKSSRTIS